MKKFRSAPFPLMATATPGLAALLLAAALLVLVMGLCIKLWHWDWLTDYVLPISMVGGMALAIPITQWVTGVAL